MFHRLIVAFVIATGMVALPPEPSSAVTAESQENAPIAAAGTGVMEHLAFQFGPGRLDRNAASWNEYVDFRRAVAHAIDRDALAAAADGIPLDSYVSVFSQAWSTDAWAQYDYNPGKATALLDGLCAQLARDCAANPPTVVMTTTDNNATRLAASAMIGDMLAAVGINYVEEHEDPAVLFGPTLDEGTFDTSIWAWVGTPSIDDLKAIHGVFDPDSPPPAGANFYRWGTPDSSVIDADTARFAELVDLMEATADEAEILGYVNEAENILADHVVIIPLWERSDGAPFNDVPADHLFVEDIEWLADEGITKGCNPPDNTEFCPDAYVTRGQMAAFLVRALGYDDDGGGNLFTDDDGHVFETDIDKLGTAGVTKGCNPPDNTKFCPNEIVTRAQMAAFLRRALE